MRIHPKIDITKLYFFVLIISLLSCVEEYWPELRSVDDKILVVEGLINNDDSPYTVKLSRSHSLDSIPASTSSESDFDPVSDAIVTIVDNLGNSETLNETEPGIYITTENGIQGIIGHKYKLEIETSEGESYESEFEEIVEPVGIESVDFHEGVDEKGRSGVQFYVSTDQPTDTENYYFWELIETHEYKAAYRYTQKFDGTFANREYNGFGQLTYIGYSYPNPPYNLLEVDHPDGLFTCWKTEIIKENIIQTTRFLTNPKLENLPVHFVPFGDERLRVKYSLLVKQHRISRNLYNFLKVIEEQNSYSESDLYTKQPYQIRGNIKNLNNPEEPVLGYFMATGVSSKRTFTPPDEYALPDHIYSATNCRLLTVRWDENGNPENFTESHIEDLTVEWNINYPYDFTWLDPPLYLTWVWIKHPRNDPVTYELGFAAIASYCSDCRLRGGTNIKPDYWE